MLDLMLALPNAFHTSSHLLAHLCAPSPHHILALHEILSKLCLQLCLGDIPHWKVQPSPTPAPYKARSDWPVMPWLALSVLPHCAQEQWVHGIMMAVVLCRRDPEGPPSLFGVTGVSPVSVHPLTAPGGHETGEESSLPASRIKGACGSLGWLCDPLWGFLQPSPPH